MFEKIRECCDDKTIAFRASGKLADVDYQSVFIPEIEEALQKSDKINLLFHMDDFHGWNMGALWDDVSFGWKIRNKLERIAIVGEAKWQQRMSAFVKPFTSAEVRYFDSDQLDEAKAWISTKH